MEKLIVILFIVLLWILYFLFDKKQKTVLAHIIDFYKKGNTIYPVYSYELDGKKYRCVMCLLSCEDTKENREKYMNEERKFSCYKKYPNELTLISSFSLKYLLIFISLVLLVGVIFI